MTINDKIDQLVWNMDTWGYQELLDWAREARRNMLQHSEDELVESEFTELFGDKPD